MTEDNPGASPESSEPPEDYPQVSPQPVDQDGYQPFEWTYLGRYTRFKGGLGGRWLDHRGQEVMFQKPPKGGVVGGVYQVEALADSSKARVADPTYLRPGADDEVVADARLRDRAAYLEDQGRKAVARAAKENQEFGELSLDQVRRMMTRRGGLPRGALLVAVVAYLEDGL